MNAPFHISSSILSLLFIMHPRVGCSFLSRYLVLQDGKPCVRSHSHNVVIGMIDMLDCTVQYLNNDTPVMILESDAQHARWERTRWRVSQWVFGRHLGTIVLCYANP